jgi:hypothetical protein
VQAATADSNTKIAINAVPSRRASPADAGVQYPTSNTGRLRRPILALESRLLQVKTTLNSSKKPKFHKIPIFIIF